MAQNDNKTNSTEEIDPKHFLDYLKDGEDMKLIMKNYRVLPKSMLCENMIGKPYLMSSHSLRTIDWSKTFNLLSDYKININDFLSINALKSNDLFNGLLSTESLLTQYECMDIITRCNELSLQELNTIPGYDRKSSRLVIFDKDFASSLWERLEKPLTNSFKDKTIKVHPLGFNVLAGEWNFSGVNEAMRFNQYESSINGMFPPHRDAQFCPSGNERSLLSLVIYLNDDFSGGETKFYFPKQLPQSHEKGLTMKQELEFNGGLGIGYDSVIIKPKCGNAVLFNQNIIHQSVPLIHSGQSERKYVIKTDIMLYRSNVENGFTLSKEEEKDYVTCINLFRLAQQKELFDMLPPHKDSFKDIVLNDIANESAELSANELYEKYLSLRYAYPTQEMINNWNTFGNQLVVPTLNYCLLERVNDTDLTDLQIKSKLDQSKPDALRIFPDLVWDNIMRRLPESDKLVIISVFSGLNDLKEILDIPKLQPSKTLSSGVLTMFTFLDTDFVRSHMESIARMAALHSVFLLGTPANPRFPLNCSDFGMYPVSYDPKTNEAVAVEINQFFRDVFYQRTCYGAVFKVMQQGERRDPMTDLAASVDRSLMVQRFSQEFTGCSNVSRNICENHKTSKASDFNTFLSKMHALNLIDNCFPLDDSRNGSHGDCEVFINSKIVYSESLQKCCQGNVVGGAIIRVMKQPVVLGDLSSDFYCYCDGLLGTSDEAIGKNAHTLVYNHLIADFRKQQFTVKLANDQNDCCPFHVFDIPLKHAYNNHLQVHLIVDISSLETTCNLSFNHAGGSCSCYMDKVHLDKYINLRSYPYLNHVHVVFEENKDGMCVWTSFGGVAAL